MNVSSAVRKKMSLQIDANRYCTSQWEAYKRHKKEYTEVRNAFLVSSLFFGSAFIYKFLIYPHDDCEGSKFTMLVSLFPCSYFADALMKTSLYVPSQEPFRPAYVILKDATKNEKNYLHHLPGDLVKQLENYYYPLQNQYYVEKYGLK